MPRAYASTVIDAPAKDVWQAIRDFGTIADWHPAIKVSKLDGDGIGDRVGAVRRLTLADGAAVAERLLTLDDLGRSYTYSLFEGPFPVTNYQSAIRVFAVTDGNASFIEWYSTFDCEADATDAMVGTFTSAVYKTGLDSLKLRFAR